MKVDGDFEYHLKYRNMNARLFVGQGVYTLDPLDGAEAERRKRKVEKRKAKDKVRKRIGDKARKRNRK